VQPVLGREFTTIEDRTGGAPVAILSFELWKRLYQSDRGAIGRALLLRGEPYTVVGVMPEGFRTVAAADVWTPLRAARNTGEGSGTNFVMIARLRPGAEWATANSEVEALGARINEGRKFRAGVSVRYGAVPLQDALAHTSRKTLLAMWGAVVLVLLIGCVNIAGLTLARARTRIREIATRAALGAGRAAVVRQMLTESVLLASLGGAAGIALGYAGIRVLTATMGIWQEMRLDERVLAASVAMTLLTSIVFGLLPAIAASRVDIRTALAAGGGKGVAGAQSRWPRRLLVAGEVALGLVLLTGAGLLIRTFLHLRNLTPGFDSTNVLTASISLQDARYRTSANMNRLFTETLTRMRALPGVEAAAVGLHVPYQRWLNNGARVPGRGTGDMFTVNVNYVTPGYFETLRIRTLAGRIFDERDTPTSLPVAIVNEAFVRRHLGGDMALGTHVQLGRSTREIVGIAVDTQQRAGWGNSGPLAAIPAVYIPAAQVPDAMVEMVHTWFSPSWVVRATGSRQDLLKEMQRAVQQTDPLLPFASFRSMDEVRSANLSPQRFYAGLLGCLAALALLLAAVGIYGLIANEVVARTRELGIRLALGATRRQAIFSAAAPGMVLAGAGVIAGCALALLAVRVLRGMVYGLSTTDPATFAGVSALLLTVAALASFVPALRLLRLDPAATLRQE
jgi:predicted permease